MGLLDVLIRHKSETSRVTVGVYDRPPFGRGAEGPVSNTQLMVRKVTTVQTQSIFGFVISEATFERLHYFAVHRLRAGGYRSFMVSSDDLNVHSTTINTLYEDTFAEVLMKEAL